MEFWSVSGVCIYTPDWIIYSVCIYLLTTWEMKEGSKKFKASIGYIVRLSQKQTKQGNKQTDKQ